MNIKAHSAYSVIDEDDKGSADLSRHLVVNSVGYYEFDEPIGPTRRPMDAGTAC